MTQTNARGKQLDFESLLLGLITLFALALRSYHLGNKGFWGDEIWTAQVAVLPTAQLAEQTIPLMLSNFIPGPLYYWLGHGALAFFGQSQAEFALRLPAAIASTLAVPAFYYLAKELCGSKVGLAAALLLAVSPLQVWYAQEARFYAWTVLLSILSTWALVRASKAPGSYLAWMGFIAANAASLYNQPLPALAVLLAQGTFVVASALRRRPRRPLLLAASLSLVVTLLLYAPILSEVLAAGYFASQPQSVTVAQSSFFAPSLADWSSHAANMLADIVTRFATPGAGLWLFLVLAIVGLICFVRARQLAPLAMMLSFFAAALAIFAIGHPATGYIVRYVLFLQPTYLLGVAAGVVCLADASPGRKPVRRFVASGALALLLTSSLLTVALGYQTAKINDWRAIAAYLERHSQPGDIITGNQWFQGAVAWYWDDRSSVSLCPDTQPLIWEELASGRRVWYVLLGESDGLGNAELASALSPIPVDAWGQTGLNYAPSFFPIYEYPASLLTGGSGANASIRFCEIAQPDWTDRSYRNVEVDATVRFRLTLPASTPRYLELTYFDHPEKLLAVQIDDQPAVTLGGGGGAWQTARLPVLGENATIVVAVTGLGPEVGGISAARLTSD